jgi:hypothetical protein
LATAQFISGWLTENFRNLASGLVKNRHDGFGLMLKNISALKPNSITTPPNKNAAIGLS